MSKRQNRVPAGVPSGGQFTSLQRAESEILLADADDSSNINPIRASPATRLVLLAALTRLNGHRRAHTAAALAKVSGGHWPSTNVAEFCAGLDFVASTIIASHKITHLGARISLPDPGPTDRDQFLSALMARESRAYNGKNPRVLITRLACRDGRQRFIVNIPGTKPGFGPTGIQSDVSIMAGGQRRFIDSLSGSVMEAMQAEGISRDDEVLLAGHSLGGMIAAHLASRPEVRAWFNIRSIVAIGAPISGYKIPGNVSVLAFEHDRDPIPHLADAHNPREWETIVARSPGPNVGIGPHKSGNYADTIAKVEVADDPRIERWRDRHSAFFDSRPAESAFPLLRSRDVAPNGITHHFAYGRVVSGQKSADS